MSSFTLAVLRVVRAPGWWLCSIFAFAWALCPSAAVAAACLMSAAPEIRELQTLVDKDATRALIQVQTLLRAPQPDPQRLAALYGVQAQAYGILERDDDARNAALAGLKFGTLASDPVRLDLLSTYGENAYDAAEIDAALRSIDAARASQAAGSQGDNCLLIIRGLLQSRQDRPDLAISSLTQ